jgi:two-component system sensor histidine kinase BarA
VDIDDNVPETVYGDEKHISKALSHLLANAVKFTGEKGEILLKVSVPNREGEILVLQFDVIDNGIGISKEHQENIFSLFEQVDECNNREFEGIGSGLFITKQIVKMMGGQILVESEPGKGSKFVITLKVAK